MLSSFDFTSMRKEGIKMVGDEIGCGSNRISPTCSEREYWQQSYSAERLDL